MTGNPRPLRNATDGSRGIGTLRALAATVVSASVLFGATAMAPAAWSADNAATSACGSTSTPGVTVPKRVDLVIDDSGSMFVDDAKQPLDRWSYAKYSLEVFAAMMRPEDTLNVYRMSDFAKNASSGPTLTLNGSQSTADRVAQIHAMQLLGDKTPYAPVKAAMADLVKNQTGNGWLVVLTDGQFNDRSTAEVESDLADFVKGRNGKDDSVQVGFLGLGPDAVEIAADPNKGIYFAKAAQTDELLREMTAFSNRIFERNYVPGQASVNWSPDIDMEQVVVFAQGPNVSIGSATTSGGAIAPESVVDVKWVDNAPIGTKKYPAIPNKALQGKLASFGAIPKGTVTFDVKNQSTLDLIYKPKVDFGAYLTDEQGNRVDAGEIVGGKYKIVYGFMDDKCNVIASDLLGDVAYSATVSQNGEVIAEDFKSGDSIELQRGDVVLDASANYLNGASSASRLDFKVLQAATPGQITVQDKSYKVSEMQEFPTLGQGQNLEYVKVEKGVKKPFSQEEWDAIDPEDFSVASDAKLDFKVVKNPKIGSLTLLARAPNGDVYAASTGKIDATVSSTRIFDKQQIETSATVQVDVVDDISAADRWAHWFTTVGIKLLILLLLLILLAGYVFKRRFSKKVKRRPSITGTPQQVGSLPVDATGKFRVNGTRRFLPFVANTATLVYVPPGVSGFRAMKLKAGPRKTMIVTNWKQIAEKNNTAINGTELNDETKRAPSFGPSASITAATPQMSYEMTPNF